MADNALIAAAKADVEPIYAVVTKQIEAMGWKAFKKAKATIKLNREDLMKVNRLFELCQGMTLNHTDIIKLYNKPVVYDPVIDAPTLVVAS